MNNQYDKSGEVGSVAIQDPRQPVLDEKECQKLNSKGDNRTDQRGKESVEGNALGGLGLPCPRVERTP